MLVVALRDPDVQVRANAAHALARLDSLPAEAIPLLIACTADASDGLRMNAALALKVAAPARRATPCGAWSSDANVRIRLIAASSASRRRTRPRQGQGSPGRGLERSGPAHPQSGAGPGRIPGHGRRGVSRNPEATGQAGRGSGLTSCAGPAHRTRWKPSRTLAGSWRAVADRPVRILTQEARLYYLFSREPTD